MMASRKSPAGPAFTSQILGEECYPKVGVPFTSSFRSVCCNLRFFLEDNGVLPIWDQAVCGALHVGGGGWGESPPRLSTCCATHLGCIPFYLCDTALFWATSAHPPPLPAMIDPGMQMKELSIAVQTTSIENIKPEEHLWDLLVSFRVRHAWGKMLSWLIPLGVIHCPT